MASPAELDAMRRAVVVSARGLGTASPNPPVGCVVLGPGGEVVGEGYHRRKGEPHAEAHALRAAGGLARGGTAAVTLEPCNHHGRTPPCHQALLDAGIARVLIAVIDPTSRGDGGAALLTRAGAEVETGVLEGEALLVLGPWLASVRRGRPFVHWICRADGTPPGRVADLAAEFDLVVTGDGPPREGGDGYGHGAGVFRVPDAIPTDSADAAAAALAASGARTVLINGPSRLGRLLVDAGFVDRLTVHQPEGVRIRALPSGFRLTGIERVHDGVRVTAEAGARGRPW